MRRFIHLYFQCTPCLIRWLERAYPAWVCARDLFGADQWETIDLKPDTAFEAAQIYLQAHAQDTQAYWTKALSQLENHTDLSGLLRLEARGVKTTRYTQVQQQAEQRFSVQGDMFRRLKGLGQ